MRPVSAITKINQNTTTRSIWKKYQSIKPDKNQFYCFKTITEILQGHQKNPLRDSKNQLYYHKVNSPKKYAKELSFKELVKQSKKKISTSAVDRNPNIKRTLTNNFFSSKQIGKQNHDLNNQPQQKVKTQIQLKSSQPKFLPYREQTLSIIKQSKILNQVQNETERYQDDDPFQGINVSNKKYNQDNKSYNARIQEAKMLNKRMALRNKEKNKHIIQHAKSQKQDDNGFQKNFKQDHPKKNTQNCKKKQKQNQQFIINEWQNGNFEQDMLTFSTLLCGKKHKLN